MVRFFAGFTLTQFRHSYIPIDHTAAVVGWNLCLIGGQTKERPALTRGSLFARRELLFSS
jgi:hypothetical protein